MFELFHFLFWLTRRRGRRVAEEFSPSRGRVLSIFRKGMEMEVPPIEEDRAMRVVEKAIKHFLSSPESAKILDFSFYPDGLGVAVYSQVESRNVIGEAVISHFVTLIDRKGISEGTILLEFDPRTLQANA